MKTSLKQFTISQISRHVENEVFSLLKSNPKHTTFSIFVFDLMKEQIQVPVFYAYQKEDGTNVLLEKCATALKKLIYEREILFKKGQLSEFRRLNGIINISVLEFGEDVDKFEKLVSGKFH